MEGSPRKTREGGAAAVDSGLIRKRKRAERLRAIGGRSLLRKCLCLEDHRVVKVKNQVREGTRFGGALGLLEG